MRRAALAIAFAARRERRNLMWRFSRLKVGAWLLLLQLAATSAALYSFARSGISLPLPSALAIVAAQSALWGAMSVITQERDRLYRRRIVELIHISAAPSYSLPLASLLTDLPIRAWISFLWAGMLAAPAGGWWSLPLLWFASLVASLASQLTATRLLVALARRQPGILTWLWALSLAGLITLVTLLIYAAVRPDQLRQAANALAPLVPPLGALLLVIAGGVGLRVALKPERLGELYRESWLAFTEATRTAYRRNSRWPAMVGGLAGSIQAKDWLLLVRNPLTWLRVGATAALLLAAILLRPWLATLPLLTRQIAAPAVAFGGALFILGEAVAASFPAEKEKLAMFAVAGGSAGRLLAGKLLAAVPVVLITATVHAVLGWCFSVEARTTSLLWEGALSGLGMVVVLVGAGALDAPRQTMGPLVDDGYQQLFEQVPTGIFSQAGLLLAAAFGAARVWGSRAWESPLVEALLWLLPLLVLLAGWLRLARFFRWGRAS